MIGKPESCQIYDQKKPPHALQYICIIHSHTYSEQNYCSLRIHVLSHHHQIVSTSYNKLSVLYDKYAYWICMLFIFSSSENIQIKNKVLVEYLK